MIVKLYESYRLNTLSITQGVWGAEPPISKEAG